MNNDYPTQKQLQLIHNWDADDFINLIEFIKEKWTYKEIKTNWHKDYLKNWVLRVEMVTCGWSGNESIINALLKNTVFGHIWYAEWKRGGRHVFEIDPKNCGYKLVAEYCIENNISRQAISKSKHKFKVVEVSKKVVFIKLKLNN